MEEQKKPQPKANLLEDNISQSLRRLAIPMTLSMALTMLMSVIDTLFVGRLGAQELAVMSFSFPVITMVMSIALGLNVGATSAISRSAGTGDPNVVRRLTTHAIMLALVIVGVVCALGFSLQDVLFRSLGAKEELLPKLHSYMNIWFAGVAFLVIPMIGNGAMQATGDTKTPAKIMAIFAVVNLVLDPLLIFQAGLGLRGAALASVIARGLTMLLSLWVVGKRLKLLDWHIPTWSELWASWHKILSVGLPAMISNALIPVSTAMLTSFVARYGSDAVAAYGLGSRIDGLLLIPAVSLGLALTPFIGQNWGAHRAERVEEALRLCRLFVIGWGLLMWLLMLVVRRPLLGIFSSDQDVVALAADYLLFVPLSYGATGVVSVTSSTFNAIDRAMRSTLLSAARSLLFAVPLAWVGAKIAQEQGVFAGLTVATILTAVLAFIWARTLLHPKDVTAIQKSAAGISGLAASMEAAFDGLLERVNEIDGVTAAARPINTIGFYYHGRELGHAHRNGHIDLHMPASVHNQLIAEGKATHHRHQHDTSWVSHRLTETSDINEAALLVRLTSIIAQIGQNAGKSNESIQKQLDSLPLSPKLRESISMTASD